MKISRNAAVPISSEQELNSYTRDRHRALGGEWRAAKKSGFDRPLYERAGFLLWRARHIADSIFASECGKFGITPPQYLVLAVVREIPGTDQAGVSRIAGLDRFTTALVLSNLIKRGLIIRQRSLRDHRRYSLRLSPRGHASLKRIQPAGVRAHTRLLSAFTRSEKRAFIGLLQKLVITLNSEARAPVDEDALPRTRSQPHRIASKVRHNGRRK